MRYLLLMFLVFLLPGRAVALEPKEIYLLVNRNVRASREIADHYCEKRGVPKENIIVLDLPTTEDMNREDYNNKIVKPLREALKDKKDQAKCLLSIYGVPLRVGPQLPNGAEKAELADLAPKMEKLQTRLRALQKTIANLEAKQKALPSPEQEGDLKKQKQDLDAVQRQIAPLDKWQQTLTYRESEACVDSELMLLWWEKYELRKWQGNMLHWRAPAKIKQSFPKVLMVSRLDGPSVAIVRSLVDKAIEVEKNGGLKGKVYIDARGIRWDAKQDPTGTGYGGYDESLREMAALLEKQAKMSVTLDDRPALFAPGSCPDCALYCGWYSLGNYVDCCKFTPGAVAYHIASGEAITLRDPNTRQWCKNLLDRGVIATLGPVAEPYTVGFPKPAEFFGFLATGEYTLVECYSRTVLLNSWMTVLVGDPLYNPYAGQKLLRVDQVQPSPIGSAGVFAK